MSTTFPYFNSLIHASRDYKRMCSVKIWTHNITWYWLLKNYGFFYIICILFILDEMSTCKCQLVLPTEVQKWEWASSTFKHLLFAKSHTLKVLSSLADNRYLPPGWNTKPRTQLSWPTNTTTQVFVPISHILILCVIQKKPKFH